MDESFSIPDHESAVRRVVSDARGEVYRPLHSLSEAKAEPDGVVIFQGDEGGQIYLTCPASLVRCSEEVLQQLLLDVDALAFNEPMSAGIYYECLGIGEGVWGGMGGGIIVAEVWVHPRLVQLGLEATARDVIEGRRQRLRNSSADADPTS